MHPVVAYVEQVARDGRQVVVLIPQLEPSHARYRILENQRGIVMAGMLSAHTEAVVCLLKIRLDV